MSTVFFKLSEIGFESRTAYAKAFRVIYAFISTGNATGFSKNFFCTSTRNLYYFYIMLAFFSLKEIELINFLYCERSSPKYILSILKVKKEMGISFSTCPPTKILFTCYFCMFILETKKTLLSMFQKKRKCNNWMSSLLNIYVSGQKNSPFWSNYYIVTIKLDFGKPLCQSLSFWKNSKKVTWKKIFKLFLSNSVLKFHLTALKN